MCGYSINIVDSCQERIKKTVSGCSNCPTRSSAPFAKHTFRDGLAIGFYLQNDKRSRDVMINGQESESDSRVKQSDLSRCQLVGKQSLFHLQGLVGCVE
jgi:hypothetical protein